MNPPSSYDGDDWELGPLPAVIILALLFICGSVSAPAGTVAYLVWPLTSVLLYLLYAGKVTWKVALTGLLVGSAVIVIIEDIDPWVNAIYQVIISIYTVAACYGFQMLLHRHVDVRHALNSREGVLVISTVWVLLCVLMAVPRSIGSFLLELSDDGLISGYFQIMFVELTGILVFTTLLMLVHAYKRGRTKGTEWSKVLTVLILQFIVVMITVTALEEMPISSMFLMAMILTPFLILSSYNGGFPGISLSISLSWVSIFFILPVMSNMVDWGSGSDFILTHLYFQIISVTGLVINAALSENRQGMAQINDRVSHNTELILDLMSFQMSLEKEEGMLRSMEIAESRLRAMNVVNHIVNRNQREQIDMGELFQEIWVAMRRPKGASIDINVRGASLDLREATYCALIFNELVANSLVHAFPDGKGLITVQLKKEPDTWKMLITDDGIGMPSVIVPDRLGIVLVESLVTKQLKGGYTLAGPPGTKWLIWFPRHI